MKTEDLMSIDEHHDEMEEIYYHHVIMDFVNLIEDYGFDKVINDFRRMMGENEW